MIPSDEKIRETAENIDDLAEFALGTWVQDNYRGLEFEKGVAGAMKLFKYWLAKEQNDNLSHDEQSNCESEDK